MVVSRPRPFNLLRWFGALSFVTVTAAAVGTAATLSHFLAEEMLQWDAMVTAEFIVTVAETQSAYGGYPRKTGVAELLGGITTAGELGISETVARASTAEFFDHMRALSGATFIRIFARDRSVAWYYIAAGYAQEMEDEIHEEREFLEQAFRFQHADPFKVIGRWDYQVAESLPGKPGRYFVENYVPLYDSQNQVAAVVEIYKEPARLLESIRRGKILVWTSLLIAGVLIFLTLFLVARRAAIVMEDQQKRLVDSETLVAIGEMALAVAHGIRSPLATIRSSAELILGENSSEPLSQAQDIIRQADRLSYWLRDLLVFSRPPEAGAERVNMVAILHESVGNFAVKLSQANATLEWIEPAVDVPPVVGNRSLLLHAFNSIIANAVEVMPKGGKLTVRYDLEQPQGRVKVSIADTGPGMSKDQLAQAFRPFSTTKPRGLGVGLTLVKRTLERYGGGVRIESCENVGTRVELTFLLAV